MAAAPGAGWKFDRGMRRLRASPRRSPGWPGDDDAVAAAGRPSAFSSCCVSRTSGLARCSIAQWAASGSLLFLVDQFEELFRYRRGTRGAGGRREAGWREEATQFVQLLFQAARDPARPVHVLLTMLRLHRRLRSFSRPARGGQRQPVPGAVFDPRPREAVIPHRSKRRGGDQPALVERLLNDAGDELDELPVLQHCLSRLWEQACHQPPETGGSTSVDHGKAEAQGNRSEPAASDLLFWRK